MNRRCGTQPNRPTMRQMRVIADPTLHPRHDIAREVAVRAVLVVAMAMAILWLLPALAEAGA
jgi:hypothetical protein